MSKGTNKDKGILAIGAAVTFCGLSLYAAERVLKYLFRDVDPDQADEQAEDQDDEQVDDDEELIDAEEPITDPE